MCIRDSNKAHDITQTSVRKSIRSVIETPHEAEDEETYRGKKASEMTKKELTEYIKKMENEMKQAAKDLQFERAASLRDQIFEYKTKL